MKKPSPEELETMKDARTASLIRRWLSGKKLTDEEKIEVSQRSGISLEVLMAGPSAPGAREAVQQAQNTRKHAKYAKKLPEYAALFGQTERTIKRWIRRGKELSELPPLDRREEMPGWWRRSMDSQVPDYLLGFAPEAGCPKLEGTVAPNVTSTDKGPPRDFTGVEALDIADNVAGLRHTHAINKKLLDEALHADPPNDTLTQLRQKNFERSFDLLRKSEITLIEVQKQRGNLIDKESVAAEIAQLLEALRLMRETMPRRILIEIEKIRPCRFQRVIRLIEKILLTAIEKARADEETIFRNLEAIDGIEAVKNILFRPRVPISHRGLETLA